MSKFGVEEIDWPAQSTDLNPTKHQTINVFQEEWAKIPINKILHLVENLPRRVEAVIVAKGGSSSY